jgi:uncharacterized protein YqeY
MNASGPQDFGKVMKSFMASHKNVDGKTVSSLLKNILEKR